MAKEKKQYTTSVRNGRFTLSMLVKGADGRIHSASCEYPFYDRVVNEKGEIESIKRTRKTLEKMLLKQLGYSAK